MGKEGEELTEQETAIYDRQIRVWGVDAQRRLSKSHIFVSGLKGTVIEFCKNIVLAGVGSLTLNDDRLVTEELLSANFLAPSDENVTHGKSLGDLANFDVEFFQKFDAVVISCCSLMTKKSVNVKCRKLPRRVAFYTVECRDSCGEIFVDLQNYSYSKKKNEETTECQLQYPSFELQSLSPVSYSYLMKHFAAYVIVYRVGDSICTLEISTQEDVKAAMRVIERFEVLEKRNPQDTSADDLPKVLNLRKQLCEAQSINESQIPDTLLQRLLAARVEFPPVCAIIGGVLGQEVIKAISGKGDPLKNFFLFDAMDGKGIIEDVSNMNS